MKRSKSPVYKTNLSKQLKELPFTFDTGLAAAVFVVAHHCKQFVPPQLQAAFLMRRCFATKNSTSFSNVRLKVYHFINVV